MRRKTEAKAVEIRIANLSEAWRMIAVVNASKIVSNVQSLQPKASRQSG
jgi:hypothetical protein